MTLVGVKLSSTVGQRLPLLKIGQIRKKRKKNLLNTSSKSLKTVFAHFSILAFPDSKVTPRMLDLWCYISDFERRHQRSSLNAYSSHILSGSSTEEGHICPEFSSSPFSRPSPSILKIKQVCKRDLRSMNSHQPHHLATVCFLSKWGLLLRAANDIEIYAVAQALPLEFGKMKK